MENINFDLCPKGPDYRINWNLIDSKFEWFKRLKHVKQDPIYHKEGDVYTHTKMACEKLVSFDEWRSLDENDRILTFTAMLMHDIAKPFCSYENNGRITSRGHDIKGELIARSYIYRNKDNSYNFPIEFREKIVKLIRYHILPLKFMKNSDPQKEIIKVSQMVRLDFLEMITRADILGRKCNDTKKLLEKIEQFKEYCIENECYEKPWEFKNEFSRFMYFYKEGYLPTFEVSNDTKFEVVVMVGLPSVGKDTFLRRNFKNIPVVTIDSVKGNLDINTKDTQNKALQNAKEKAREYMRDRNSFAWNATNITRSLRQQIIKLFIDYGGKINICYVEAPYEEVIRRNLSKEKCVSEKVLEKLINKLDVPDFTEAHTVSINEMN
jgi:predicted kinase